MGDWFKKRWKSIEGRVLWTLLGIPGAAMLTLLPIKAFQMWMHQPATNSGVGAACLISAMIVAAILIIIRDRMPRLNLRVSPTSGPSSSMCLTVTNLGKPTTVSAFCQTVGHPNGVNEFRKGEIRVGWEGGIQRKLLNKDESANLLIATFAEVIALDLSELVTWEIIEGKSVRFNSARWNQHPDETLPSFDLKIRVVGDNTKSPKTFTFTVRPCRFTGPLEVVNLVEVRA